MGSAPATLDEVLEPVSAAEFIDRSLSKNFQYIRGQRGKFERLFPWTDVNRVLEQHRLDVPRLRLVREGKPVPAEAFISYDGGSRSRIPRLRPSDLTGQLRSGATLIVDAVDELQPPISQLAENLELTLRCRIQVNMYAGWRTSHGFDLHWDGHDVLILQVAGRKHWKVYPMTTPHPMPETPKGTAPHTPLWEGTLNDGDVLYIPRGWWHVAIPLDEPTLHLTVGLHHLTTSGFIDWFARKLKDHVAFRKDVPVFQDGQERASLLAEMKETWEQAWNLSLLDEYIFYSESRRRPRAHFGLPWTATPALVPPENEKFMVHWLAANPAVERDGNGEIVVSSGGKEWRFAAAAGELLQHLANTRSCSFEELSRIGGEKIERGRLRAFIKELVSTGLATIGTG